MRLDASHLYGDDDDDWQAGLTAGLQLTSRGGASADVSLRYGGANDMQALSARAALIVPLR